MARPRVARDHAEVFGAVEGNGKTARRLEVAVLDFRDSVLAKRHDPVTSGNSTRFGHPVDKKFHGRPWKTYRRIVSEYPVIQAQRPSVRNSHISNLADYNQDRRVVTERSMN